MGSSVKEREDDGAAVSAVLSISSSISAKDIGDIRDSFGIPLAFRLSRPEWKMPAATLRVGSGFVIYRDAFASGLRLPFHPDLVAVLNYFRLAPGRWHPNAWRIMLAYLSLIRSLALSFNLNVFRHFVFARSTGKDKQHCWYYLSFRSAEHRLFYDIPNKVDSWKTKFFVVSSTAGNLLPLANLTWEGSLEPDLGMRPKLNKAEYAMVKKITASKPYSSHTLITSYPDHPAPRTLEGTAKKTVKYEDEFVPLSVRMKAAGLKRAHLETEVDISKKVRSTSATDINRPSLLAKPTKGKLKEEEAKVDAGKQVSLLRKEVFELKGRLASADRLIFKRGYTQAIREVLDGGGKVVSIGHPNLLPSAMLAVRGNYGDEKKPLPAASTWKKEAY